MNLEVDIAYIRQFGLPIIRMLEGEIANSVQKPTGESGGQINPLETNRFFLQCQQVVEEEALRIAQGNSSLQWLRYLRKVPIQVFSGFPPKIEPFKALLAEAISGCTGTRANSIAAWRTDLALPMTPDALQQTIELCTAVNYLAHLDSLRRWCNYNVPFRFGESVLPEPVADTNLRTSIHLYDERRKREALHTISTVPAGSTGTPISSYIPHGKLSVDENAVLKVLRLDTPSQANVEIHSLGERKRILQHVRYGPVNLSFRQLANLNSDSRLANRPWWSQEATWLLLLSRALHPIVLNSETITSSVLAYGFFVMKRNELEQEMQDILPKAVSCILDWMPDATLPFNAEELVQWCVELAPSILPLPCGRIIHQIDDMVCVDVVSATVRCERALEFPRNLQGNEANARATHFEFRVQDVIDESSWKPSDASRQYRGRKLRLVEGTDITDIDAIGERNNVLLIVDCKSVIDDGNYATADFRALRNVATSVQEWVSKWDEKHKILVKNPSGANYDFSSFRQIIHAVCLPFAPFVTIGQATRLMDNAGFGLRAACSINELKTWVNQ